MPFDFVKTLSQREEFLSKYTFKIISNTYRENGLKKLYIGWQFRLAQYSVQAIMTCTALENLEIKRKMKMNKLDENGNNENKL